MICRNSEMGNKKNKTNKKNSSHRHAYFKKRVPTKLRMASTRTTITATDTHKKATLDGSRIVNLEKLQQYTDRLTQHSAHCDGSVVLYGESRDGLASILTAECGTCGISFNLDTSKKVKGPRGYSR